MRKAFVAFVVFLCGACQTTKPQDSDLASVEANRLEQSFRDGKSRQEVNRAIGQAILAAGVELTKRGEKAKADKMTTEWNQVYQGFLLDDRLKDVGDHDPVVWLYDVWFMLNGVMGEQAMKSTHLDDIWEFSMTIRVVFKCEDMVDEVEYQKHFVMLSGATAYWVTFAVCSGATYGTATALACGPAGTACEYIVDKTIAPRLAPFGWKIVCKQ